MIELTTSKDREVEREPLFSIDGQEVTIPKTFSAAFALRYIDRHSKYGVDASSAWLLENALGSEGWALLINFEDLKAEDVAQILEGLIRKVLGAMDVPKGALKAV